MILVLALYAVWLAAICAAEWLQRRHSGKTDADGR